MITQRAHHSFIDELHNLFGAGPPSAIDRRLSIAQAGAGRRELQTMARRRSTNTASTSSAQRPGAPLPADPRRPATTDETVQILKGMRDRYEAHPPGRRSHDEALEPRGARRPLHLRRLPARAKASDLIDEAASRMRIQVEDLPAGLPRPRGGDRGTRARKEASDSRPRSREGRPTCATRSASSQQEARARGAVGGRRVRRTPAIGEEEIADIVSCGRASRSSKLPRPRPEAHAHGGGAPQSASSASTRRRGRLQGDSGLASRG